MSESSLLDRRPEHTGVVVGVFAKQTHGFAKEQHRQANLRQVHLIARSGWMNSRAVASIFSSATLAKTSQRGTSTSQLCLSQPCSRGFRWHSACRGPCAARPCCGRLSPGDADNYAATLRRFRNKQADISFHPPLNADLKAAGCEWRSRPRPRGRSRHSIGGDPLRRPQPHTIV